MIQNCVADDAGACVAESRTEMAAKHLLAYCGLSMLPLVSVWAGFCFQAAQVTDSLLGEELVDAQWDVGAKKGG